MNLQEATDLFLAELRRSGYSLRTADAYLFDLTRFQRFLKESSGKNELTDLSQLDATVIKRWMDAQIVQGNTPRTLARKLSSLRAFFKFAVRERWLEESPMKDITAPRFRRQPPDTLSQDEIRQILQAPDPDSPNYTRDRAILHLLYSTGLRVSELSSLTLESINFEQQSIRVRGKGAKDRIVPLMDAARVSLLDYALHREKTYPKISSPKSPFFLRDKNNSVTPSMIRYILLKCARKALIRPHVYPHLIRHSIATHLVEEGCSLDAVRQTLGHEDLATTSIYLKTSKKFVMNEHKKFNPINRLSK